MTRNTVDIKYKNGIVCAPPDWIAKPVTKEIKIRKDASSMDYHSVFSIEYDGTCSNGFERINPPTDSEIDFFCDGVRAAREMIIDKLADENGLMEILSLCKCSEELVNEIKEDLRRQL